MNAEKEELVAEHKMLSEKLQALNIDYIQMLKHSHLAKWRIQDCDASVE